MQIDSPGLGGMHLGLLLAILGYVLVFPLLYQTKYLEFAVGVYQGIAQLLSSQSFHHRSLFHRSP